MAGRNINNLRYADDIIPMAESKEESEKVDLKFNIQKLRSWHPVSLLYGK